MSKAPILPAKGKLSTPFILDPHGKKGFTSTAVHVQTFQNLMADELAASLAASFSLSDAPRVDLGIAGAAAIQDSHHYMVGRLLTRKPFVAGFIGTMPSVWRQRSGLSIREVENRFVFQFDRREDRNRVLNGGPWFYRNAMLLLGVYDGLGDAAAVPLRNLETWVSVKGLPPLLRNPVSLSMVGSAMGRVIRFDQMALTRKEVDQRIRLVLDTRRRLRTRRQFMFSSEVVIDLEFVFERIKGFCTDCGLLEHDVRSCDRLLVKEAAERLNPPTTALAGLSLRSPSSIVDQAISSVQLFGAKALNVDPAGSGAKPRNPPGFFMSDQTRSGLLASGLLTELEKSDLGLRRPKDSIFTVMGFSAKSFAAIPKCGEEVPTVTATPAAVCQIIGQKRPAAIALIRPGKTRCNIAPPANTVLQEADDLALVIPNDNGRLLISPVKKKKLGRPKGAKNKVKLEGVQAPKPKAVLARPKFKGKKGLLKLLAEDTPASSD